MQINIYMKSINQNLDQYKNRILIIIVGSRTLISDEQSL